MNDRVRHLVIESKRSVRGLLDGLWKSRYKGRGIEFEELRSYSPGDPISDISWTHLATWDRLLVKRYREERDLKIWILFDVSASVFSFGSKRRDRMADLASLITLAALDQRDRVGLLFFSDKEEKLVLPRRMMGSAPYLLKELVGFQPKGTGTDWEIPFSYLSRTDPHGGAIIFLISDFASLPKSSSLFKLSLKNELVGIFVEEPFEEKPLPKGQIFVEDAETGKMVALNTLSASFQKRLDREREAKKKELYTLFNQAKGSVLALRSDKEPLAELIAFLKRRK